MEFPAFILFSFVEVGGGGGVSCLIPYWTSSAFSSNWLKKKTTTTTTKQRKVNSLSTLAGAAIANCSEAVVSTQLNSMMTYIEMQKWSTCCCLYSWTFLRGLGTRTITFGAMLNSSVNVRGLARSFYTAQAKSCSKCIHTAFIIIFIYFYYPLQHLCSFTG